MNRFLLKSLKVLPENLWQKFYLSDYTNWLFKIINEIRSKREMFDRILFWGWKMRHSYDFDANTIYQMLYLKYLRTYQCMKNHGSCTWNSDINTKDMRRLRTLTEVCRRLSEDNYLHIAESDEKYWIDFHKNWRINRNSDKKGKFHRICLKSDILKKQDKEMFTKLFKYNDGFWD